MSLLRIASVVVALFAFDNRSIATEAQSVRVFILAGQSNMEGQAVVDLDGPDYNEGRGTLKTLWNSEEFRTEMAHLQNSDGQWSVRNDVWVRYQRESQPILAGPLGLGFSVYGDQHHFGPELQFGHLIGDVVDEPVLLIKTAWGGKSLYKDFRPPSSGGEVGPYYTKMIQDIRLALNNIPVEFPELKVTAIDLAGFVWYQGWNDGVEPDKAIPEYEQNLVNLIRDVREEFQTPDLPFVVGELTGAWVDAPQDWTKLRDAQKAACSREEVGPNVRFVETRHFVRKPEDSPNPGHGHHEFGNAETYLRVGNALGLGMQELLHETPSSILASTSIKSSQSQPTRRVEQELHGWKVHVDDRLLKDVHFELGKKTLRFLESKLSDICEVVPPSKLALLKRVPIVLDYTCGELKSMQYHPNSEWLEQNGYSAELAKCVHIPQAAVLPTSRNINEQPWVILHWLAQAYHDQVLGFDDLRIKDAYKQYLESSRGDSTLLFSGERVKHYALANQLEFFAEMTEAYFGANDFFPFNRAELKTAEPEIYDLMSNIWSIDD